MAETGGRICNTRSQQAAKPGRQLITFLLFANITLWILDTFMTHNWVTQEIQLNFYGLLAWGVISRISLPLMIFYRFHSCVVLVEIWKNTYRTKEVLWGLPGPTASQVNHYFIKPSDSVLKLTFSLLLNSGFPDLAKKHQVLAECGKHSSLRSAEDINLRILFL